MLGRISVQMWEPAAEAEVDAVQLSLLVTSLRDQRPSLLCVYRIAEKFAVVQVGYPF